MQLTRDPITRCQEEEERIRAGPPRDTEHTGVKSDIVQCWGKPSKAVQGKVLGGTTQYLEVRHPAAISVQIYFTEGGRLL